MSASDLIIYAAVILAACFMFVLGMYVWGQFNTAFNSTAGPTGSAAQTLTNVNNSFNIFDTLLVFLQIGLLIGVIISFFYLDSHPIYFFLSIFILVMAIIVGAVFSNVWYELGQTAMNSTIASKFVQTDWLMDNMPIVLLFAGVVGLIVLYGKMGGGGT